MRLVDTHCHIHEHDYPLATGDVLTRAHTAGVTKLICVGTDLRSSSDAVMFVKAHAGDPVGTFASIGIHPHEAVGVPGDAVEQLRTLTDPKIIAVGEIGLDYFYGHSPRKAQIGLLEAQLQLAIDRGVPVIFHVRSGQTPDDDAFADFWPVFANFHGLRGVLHSFTDSDATLDKALANGLFVGVNGISTFTRDPKQQAMFDRIPLEKLLLETDAPYLTPPPFRGTINESAYVSLVASYHANRRGISEDQIATTTTASAEALFGI